ncbi:MAG TPA: metal ABC transporter substrate-binding protein [Solirubrobacteraceae bacterium]|nr:metal ABC transporter substrate-binding protein [Solirubrobacteraceae bacterium]
MTRLLWLPLLLLAAALPGCGSDAAAGEAFTVVATTTQVADLARNVAGPDAHVVQLLQPNADPHDYEIRPHDVGALADADLIVRSGGEADAWVEDAIDGAGSDAPVVDLSDGIELRDDDPHWWQDPRNAIVAVHELERALDGVDPGGRPARARRTEAYEAKLRRLDRDTAACVAELPGSERKLVTTHDSLGYYAARYGLDVIGAVIPSQSTEGQPSAGDIADLIATIRAAGVKAVFAESSVEPKVEAAIARETGATVGTPLWADTLGPAGSSGATYIDSIRANTRAIVAGLSGSTVSCGGPGR